MGATRREVCGRPMDFAISRLRAGRSQNHPRRDNPDGARAGRAQRRRAGPSDRSRLDHSVGEGVTVIAADGNARNLTSRFVVGADGLRSVVGRRLGLTRPSRFFRPGESRSPRTIDASGTLALSEKCTSTTVAISGSSTWEAA